MSWPEKRKAYAEKLKEIEKNFEIRKTKEQ
jgi:hypothetical protein